jgi:hypothetical protein
VDSACDLQRELTGVWILTCRGGCGALAADWRDEVLEIVGAVIVAGSITVPNAVAGWHNLNPPPRKPSHSSYLNCTRPAIGTRAFLGNANPSANYSAIPRYQGLHMEATSGRQLSCWSWRQFQEHGIGRYLALACAMAAPDHRGRRSMKKPSSIWPDIAQRVQKWRSSQ